MRKPHPHRLEVLLAPKIHDGGDWSLQRSFDGESWKDTEIRRSTRLPGNSNLPDLQALISELEVLKELTDVSAPLHFRRQKEIGWLLSRALFGDSGPTVGKRWIHIVPQRIPDAGRDAFDYENFLDFVLRLPWPLMTDSGRPDAQALARRRLDPIAITIDGGFDLQAGRDWFEDIRLPPCPRILLIVPVKDSKKTPTYGARHIEALKQLLEPEYQKKGYFDGIRFVSCFADLENLLGISDPFSPHIIYYYGHAGTMGTDTILKLDDGPCEMTKIKSLLEALVDRTQFPPVVWINGCQSGAARINSGVTNLAPHASAVIATRTQAAVEDAQALGKSVLPRIALGGWSPASAMRDALAQQKAETVDSARWATPIVAIQYRYWTALAPEGRRRLDRESYGDIAMRLDRTEPVNVIGALIDAGIKDRARRPEVVVWRGALAHGPDLFESRFRDLVREQFPDWSPVVRRVELGLSVRLNRQDEKSPRHQERNLDLEFQISLFNALSSPSERLQSGEPDLLRLQGLFENVIAGERCILVLSHGPYEDVHRTTLKYYVRFWQNFYNSMLIDPTKCRVVVGLGISGMQIDPLPVEGATNIELIPVDPIDVSTHIAMFGGAYNTVDPAGFAREITDDGGNAFRPIYDSLRARLKLPKDDAAPFGDVQS